MKTNSPALSRMVLDLGALPASSGTNFWWRVVTATPNGETVPDVPPARFTVSPNAPAQVLPPAPKKGPDGDLLRDALRGEKAPRFGRLRSAKVTASGAGGTQVNGRDQMVVYEMPAWPEEDFTVAVRVRIDVLPQGRIGQVFSAWAKSMDDPLRLVVEHGRLFARIEAGGGFGTPGAALEAGRWYHAAAVKRDATLTLFVDGHVVGSTTVPAGSNTAAQDCALGGNPHFGGNEFLAATFADFGLWARALEEEELRRLAAESH